MTDKKRFENPFDSVKDLRHSVDFVAVSPKLKDFKENCVRLIDTDRSPGSRIHAIVGDYGRGKSHICHYVYDKGKDRDDVLVGYVSCKDLIDRTDKDMDLFKMLLNDIILDIQEQSPEEMSKEIEEAYEELHEDQAIKTVRQLAEDSNREEDEEVQEALERLQKSTEMNKENFFEIIDRIRSSDFFEKELSRMVIMIDEFEIFARDHHTESLEKVTAMREDIMHRFEEGEVVWVFSCARQAWTALSEERAESIDMFGENVTDAHFLPSYKKDDRREMIRSRMGSLYDEGSSDGHRYFPFSDRRIGGELVKGSFVARLLSRPQLYPRRLIANCYDFYDNYQRALDKHEDEKKSFEMAKEELLDTHLFDIVSEEKFHTIEDKIWDLVKDKYDGVEKDDFRELMKELFKRYLTNEAATKDDFIGFDTENQHRRLVKTFLEEVIQKNIGTRYKKRKKLLDDVEEELKVHCLREHYDHDTGKTYLEFDIDEFSPLGELPHLSEMYHRRIDKHTDSSDVISYEDMKVSFTELLKEERDMTFDEDLFERTVRDLIEAGKIEKEEEKESYRILDRKERTVEDRFREGTKEILRKGDKDFEYIFDLFKQRDESFFLPPLEKDDGYHYMKVDISCVSTKRIFKEKRFKVLFLEEVKPDLKDEIEDEEFVIVFTPPISESGFKEKTDLDITKKEEGIFRSYISDMEDMDFRVMCPSVDLTDNFDWLQWDELLGNYEEIKQLAQSEDFLEPIDNIERKLRREINNLNNKINNQKELKWDEKEYYGFKLMNIGSKKMSEYTSMVSTLISEGNLSLHGIDNDDVEALVEIFPWVDKGKMNLNKNKEDWTYEIDDTWIDDAMNGLIDFIEKEPRSWFEISKRYFQRIENRYSLNRNINNKRKEKKMMSPARLLLNAACEIFPKRYERDDGEIHLVIEEEFDVDEDGLRWFLSIWDDLDGKRTNMLADALFEEDFNANVEMISDFDTASEIYEGYLEAGDDDLLYEKSESQVEGERLKNIEFLKRAESSFRQLIRRLFTHHSSLMDSELESRFERLDEEISEKEELLGSEDLDEDVRKNLEDIQDMIDLQELRGSIDRYKEKKEALSEVIGDLSEDTDIEVFQNIFLERVEENEDLIWDIFEADEMEKKIFESLQKRCDQYDKQFKQMFTEHKNELLGFIEFYHDISSVIDDDELYDSIKEFEEEVVKKDEMTVEELSSMKGRFKKLQQQIINLTEDIIDERFEDYEETLRSYENLTLRFSERDEEVKESFLNLMALSEDRKNFKERLKEYIVEKKSRPFKRNIVENIENRREHYRKEAKRKTKKLISERYQKYLDNTAEAIEEGRVLQFLESKKEDDGRDGLVSYLEFLSEMEKNGLIDYG